MNKLKNKRSIVLYAMSGMGINLLNTMVGSYLCSALLVGGFGENAVPYQTFVQKDLVVAAVWAVFALIAKIIDGIIDIPMASFTDRLRTRWGRRRPAILLGFVLTVVSYLLFLVIPNPSGATILNTVYFGLVLCLFYTAYTLTMVTYYATYTDVVDNMADRNLLSNVKSVCDIFYFILGYVVVRMLLNGLNIRIVALIVLPLAFTMMIPLFMYKEKSTLKGEQEVESVNLFRSLKLTFKNSTFVLWMIVYSIMTFGVQLFLGGINEYFSYVGMNMIYVMMAVFVPVPFTLIIYNILIKKHGFGFAFRYVLIIFAVGLSCMGIAGFMESGTVKMVFSIFTGIISSFAVGAMFSVAYAIPSQLAAEEEKKTGISNSAMYFAVQGLFAGIATGIGTGIVLTAVKAASPVIKNAENAVTNTLDGPMKYLTFISAAACLVAMILTAFLPKQLMKTGKEE